MSLDEVVYKNATRRKFLCWSSAFVSSLFLGSAQSIAFGEEVDPNIVEPTPDEIEKAIGIFENGNAANMTPERIEAMDVLQRSVDRLRASEFETYFASSYEEGKRWESERGVLRYLDRAFDKVLRELKQTQVDEGSVVMWHIYNMGYVVKTPTQTIAIDVKHRRAAELIPFVDLLLITHDHDDHYTREFCQAAFDADKPVVSNFIDNEWKTPAEGRTYKFGDISIAVKLVDHNARLRKFVSTYEIACGPNAGDQTIFHVGDACDVRQLETTRPIDVFVPHLAVGLDVPKAVNEVIRPKTTLLSHILELGHLIDKWRWSYEYGRKAAERCANDSVYLPVWGERFVFKRGE